MMESHANVGTLLDATLPLNFGADDLATSVKGIAPIKRENRIAAPLAQAERP
jgi:hypothetical protein